MSFLTAPVNFFRNKAMGSWGTFQTPAGQVNFLMTKGKLGSDELDPVSQLTKLLLPAREALNVREMDFGQLLQRDLDDHRIATDLVPYVLRPELNGPAFFPPIVTVLLPFSGRRPADDFPEGASTIADSDLEYQGAHFNTQTYGDSFRFQSVCDSAGRNDPLGQGLLRWNEARSKLVIVDGQHRAMALLAIDRTEKGTWAETSGERYKPFYEKRVKELLKQAEDEGRPVNLSAIEFPVTICWFPEYTGPGKNPHKAARKVFVDVNQNAKKPSESRLILLSDTELDNMFARNLLSRVRDRESTIDLPLYAIEYDNPEQTTTPTRWSVLTNLEILRAMVQKTVFGPVEQIQSVDSLIAAPRGRQNESKMSARMAEQLDLLSFLPSVIKDGPRSIERSSLTRLHFPVYDVNAQKQLIDRFYDKWGSGMLLFLSKLEPYRAHVQALKGIKEGWLSGGSSTGELAIEALFEGVGMYWTLRDGHLLWRDKVRLAWEAAKPDSAPTQPEVSKAWELIEVLKRDEFRKERSRLYLGAVDEASVELSLFVYTALNTYAAQVGLVMTWATIRKLHPDLDHTLIAEAMIKAINRTLTTGPVKSRDRKAFFAKDLPDRDKAFNKLPKMDTHFSSYFRYFWLELMLEPGNHEELVQSGLDVAELLKNLRTARWLYLEALAINAANSLKESRPELDKKQREAEGRVITAKSMARAFAYWFGRPTGSTEQELLNDLQSGRGAWLSQHEQAHEVVDAFSDGILTDMASTEGTESSSDPQVEDQQAVPIIHDAESVDEAEDATETEAESPSESVYPADTESPDA
jgi:hypothetical protein